MSSVYEFEETTNSTRSLIISKFSNNVYDKHCASYGDAGARKTRDAAKKVLSLPLVKEIH